MPIEYDSLQSKVAKSDWEQFLDIPFIVFYIIAGADGKVDDQEFEGYVRCLRNTDDKILDEILANINPDFGENLASLPRNIPKLRKMLLRRKDLLENSVSKADYENFASEMLSIAKNVAESSGGILGLGDKVSQSERKALSTLEAIFGV